MTPARKLTHPTGKPVKAYNNLCYGHSHAPKGLSSKVLEEQLAGRVSRSITPALSTVPGGRSRK